MLGSGMHIVGRGHPICCSEHARRVLPVLHGVVRVQHDSDMCSARLGPVGECTVETVATRSLETNTVYKGPPPDLMFYKIIIKLFGFILACYVCVVLCLNVWEII